MLTKLLDILVPFGPFIRSSDSHKGTRNFNELLFYVIPLTFFIHWLFTFLPFGSLVYSLVLVPLSAKNHIASKKGSISPRQKAQIYLWYLVVIVVGFGGLRGFIGHFFLSDSVAQSIGWELGSPFQLELSFYHLGTAIAALMTIWIRKHLVEGLALIKSLFWIGASYVHIKEIALFQNYAPNNTGVVLVGDILLPSVFIYLLVLIYKKD